MPERFVMCARAVRRGTFIAEPGPTRYLQVPEGQLPAPAHARPAGAWFKQLRSAATWGRDARDPARARGDLLVFVHGYNNDQAMVLARHDRLRADLAAAGFKGELLTFDWPSANMALNYVEDRHDAKRTALQLVRDGIAPLAARQAPDCTVNVHLLGHSTGAYVIREAFDDADDARLANNGWTVSQIALIGADVSSASLAEGNSASESLYRHCARLTNYSNAGDAVLKLSNAKRLGMAPRAGRVGLPADAPAGAVEVDCSGYFARLLADPQVRATDQAAELGAFDHSWHIGNRVFTRDLFETLKGDLDRGLLPTRAQEGGRLILVRP